MEFKTLISVPGLAQYLNDPDWVVVDCRFWLDEPEKGQHDYRVSHIPGAVYAHLDKHLSAQVVKGKTGRHPLPDIDTLASLFSAWGIGAHTQVVAYDDRGGMIAARLWWLLKWMGHKAAAVLDGGFPAWVAEGHAVTADLLEPEPAVFNPDPHEQMLVSEEDILSGFGDPGRLLVDSRAPERFRGETEPIDPVAGRIPGAVNYFWGKNLDAKGYFEIKDILRGRFTAMLMDIPAQNVTFYCGSGVTAAHNVLAMAHAGMGMSKLYGGSWSHWITNPDLPILTGS